MLIDARTLEDGATLETDVCVVGAGAAGITLARELAGERFRVLLVESGGFEPDEATQKLYGGKNVGLRYFPLEECRMRFFGGTTSIWAGWCRPFDEIDFEARDWLPHSGWPFGLSELEPYYRRAQPICQLGPFEYGTGYWEDAAKAPRLFPEGSRVETSIYQFSPPTHFGKTYRAEVVGAENVTVLIFANVVEIETDETAQNVKGLRVATLEGGKKLRVGARLYVIAAGGIESARLLLASDRAEAAGLGNRHGLVGRFFMEHPVVSAGLLVPSDPATYSALGLYRKHVSGGVSMTGVLNIAAETMRREKITSLNVRLRPTSEARQHYREAVGSEGVKSIISLKSGLRRGEWPEEFWRHVRNVISDLDDVALVGYRKLFPIEFPIDKIVLSVLAEQAPNPESRLALSAERDALGMRRVELAWRLTELDQRSMLRSLEIIGEEAGRSGLGRVRVELSEEAGSWPPSLRGARHHMGTTRMHDDPKRGVVDRDSKLHGVSNLFVAGPSVFPTSGRANPVLTIVALALKLAKRIRELMSPGR